MPTLPTLTDITCPACGNKLTEAEVKALWGKITAHMTKGRTSDKKAKSSAENGKKGGRPRKVKAEASE